MKEIPQHCVDTFKERFGVHPSLVEYSTVLNKTDVDSLLSKSHLIWYQDFIDDNKNVVPRHKLYEYDSTGVLIYIKYVGKIFILTKVDKKNVVDYTLQQLKRLTTKKI
jgi:hypothetical protein